MTDILMVAQNDWANTGWRFSKCLELLGLDVKFYKKHLHRFGYPEQANLFPQKEDRALIINKIASEAKVIHFIASMFADLGVDLKSKIVIVQHGGSTYRKNFKSINEFFNPIVDYSIIQMPELTLLGAKNPVYISFPVDTDTLQPVYKRVDPNKLIIGHFPTSPIIKGTAKIVKIINKLKHDIKFRDKFEYIGTTESKNIVTWEQNLNRMRECDIIIDACNLLQGNFQYGEWGNSAFEAAALGKVSITHSVLADKIYKDIYGDHKLQIANNEKELEELLKRLICMNRKQLLRLKQNTRTWIVRNHSFESTAQRLKKTIYGGIFNL